MNEHEAEVMLLEVLEKYQEETGLADISGQIESFFYEKFSVPIKTIASMIDVIGESIGTDVMLEVICRDFDRHGDDATEFLHEHIGEVESQLATAVAQQVSLHSFCIGYLLAQKETEKING